ncbi:MAG: hypothetical protein J0L92_09310 [Deltaproteobacteria bacterium]|nr:hypothetical protein [Deltaproteobacteria bacterium]
MHPKLRLVRRTWIAPLGAVALTACGSQGGPPAATGALTEGRIDADSGEHANVEVRAYSLEADGSLVFASEVATTDSRGRFQLDAHLSDTAMGLVVSVEDGSGRMTLLTRSAVDASVAASGDGSLTLAPITTGSSFDAEVGIAVERMTDGAADDAAMDSIFLSGALTAELADAIDHDAAVDAAASAVVNARATFLAALDAEVDGAARGDADLVIDAMGRLEGELAIALDAATTVEAEDAAWAAFFDHSIAAMIDAGYDAEAIASASITSRSSLDAYLAGHVSSGEASLSLFTTFATTAAIDAGLADHLDASAVTSAGTTLRSDVMANARAHADAAATTSVWARYDASIDSAITARLGTATVILVELTSSVEASAQILADGFVALGTNASASARVDAYASYAEEVSSMANANLLSSGSLTIEEADAALDAMAWVHAAH